MLFLRLWQVWNGPTSKLHQLAQAMNLLPRQSSQIIYENGCSHQQGNTLVKKSNLCSNNNTMRPYLVSGTQNYNVKWCPNPFKFFQFSHLRGNTIRKFFCYKKRITIIAKTFWEFNHNMQKYLKPVLTAPDNTEENDGQLKTKAKEWIKECNFCNRVK